MAALQTILPFPKWGPRERALEEGVERLGDAELVAVLLGTGTSSEPVCILAANLLEELGGLDGLLRVGAGALAARSGIGPVKGVRLAAAVELGRRVLRASTRRTAQRFPESRTVDTWARPRLANLDHEELWALALDGQHRLRAARRVAMGGLSDLHVAPRDPLRAILREGAQAFVLVHNHPSGDPRPSREDIAFTARMAHAGSLLGTPLLDHVVVARDGYVSLLDEGLIPDTRIESPSIESARGVESEGSTKSAFRGLSRGTARGPLE